MEYKVTMYIKAVTHPRKWLVEGVNDMLNEDESEDILEWEIEPMEYIDNG